MEYEFIISLDVSKCLLLSFIRNGGRPCSFSGTGSQTKEPFRGLFRMRDVNVLAMGAILNFCLTKPTSRKGGDEIFLKRLILKGIVYGNAKIN